MHDKLLPMFILYHQPYNNYDKKSSFYIYAQSSRSLLLDMVWVSIGYKFILNLDALPLKHGSDVI